MSNLQTFFIKFAFYGAYFCFSLPAFFFIRKHGYKNSIVLGLLMYAGGAVLFFPAANLMNYTLYLIAFYIMAGGCSVLETVANPYIMAMESDADKGIRKLNLAQSFNPLGSIFGIIICNIFVMESDTFGFNNNTEIIKEELDTITIVYAAIGQILLIYMMILLFMNVPSYGLTSKDKILFSKSMNRLLNNKSYILGLITMFLYL
ncbi:MAG: MFS transporter [Bacteroidales bacterium]|nr:MFS transporter [Bacteroidales bacterium]